MSVPSACTATLRSELIVHSITFAPLGPGPGGATIGEHVFISCNSSIIGTVTVGDGAVIAANTLVIGDVPAGTTAIGVPARILPAADGMMTKPRGRP
jgi:serine O-acetyltransferase